MEYYSTDIKKNNSYLGLKIADIYYLARHLIKQEKIIYSSWIIAKKYIYFIKQDSSVGYA